MDNTNSEAYNSWYSEELMKKNRIDELDKAEASIAGINTPEANEARERLVKARTSLQNAHPRVMRNRSYLQRIVDGVGNLFNWATSLLVRAFQFMLDVLQGFLNFMRRAIEDLALCFQG